MGAQIRLAQTMQQKLNRQRTHLEDLSARRVLSVPTAYIDTKRMELDHERDRLIAVSEKVLSAKHREFATYAAKLDTLSPLKVLARGYSVVQNQAGQTVLSAEEVSVGETVKIQLNRSRLTCCVEEKVEEHG